MAVDLHRGYDFFIKKPNVREQIECKVCGTKCEVSKGVKGYVSMATSMAGKKVKHDQFSCPNHKEKWHIKAYKLVKEIEETESKRIKELVQKDLADILEENLD